MKAKGIDSYASVGVYATYDARCQTRLAMIPRESHGVRNTLGVTRQSHVSTRHTRVAPPTVISSGSLWNVLYMLPHVPQYMVLLIDGTCYLREWHLVVTVVKRERGGGEIEGVRREQNWMRMELK